MAAEHGPCAECGRNTFIGRDGLCDRCAAADEIADREGIKKEFLDLEYGVPVEDYDVLDREILEEYNDEETIMDKVEVPAGWIIFVNTPDDTPLRPGRSYRITAYPLGRSRDPFGKMVYQGPNAAIAPLRRVAECFSSEFYPSAGNHSISADAEMVAEIAATIAVELQQDTKCPVTIVGAARKGHPIHPTASRV